MGKKLITGRRLTWSGIVILIALALFFLPGIRKRAQQQQKQAAPAGREAAVPSPSNAAVPAAPLPVTPPPLDAQGRSILFHVVEASTGRPIENAALFVGLYAAIREMQPADAARTDRDGNCSIHVPAPPINVVVRAETYVSRRLVFSKAEDYPEEYTFKLERGSSIGGYVHDETGKPIADVKLSITSSNMVLQTNSEPSSRDLLDTLVATRTDVMGRWTASEVLPNPERIGLTLEHKDYATAQFTTEAVSSTPTISTSTVLRPLASTSMTDLRAGKAVLVMQSGVVIAGTVMDESGRGIGAAEIKQFEKNPPNGTYNLPRATANSEPDGKFVFRSLKPGEIVIAVQAKGFAPEYRIIKLAQHMPEIEFRLKKGEIISGRVVTEAGNPIAGASIQTSTAGADQPISWTGKSDADGRFLWDSAPVKPLSYHINAEGYKSPGSMTLDSSKEHEIRLTRLAEVSVIGKVVDSQTRMPLESFKVSTVNSLAPFPANPIDGKNGEFTLTVPIRSGASYILLVEADGYIPDGSQVVDDKESNRNVEIAMVRGGSYTGTVTLPDGNPANGASVILCGGNLTMAYMPLLPTMMSSIRTIRCSNSSRDVFTSAAVADGSGRFSLSAVAQAHSIYAAHEKGFAAIALEKLASSSRIVLQPWGRVEGTLMIGTKPGVGQRMFLSKVQSNFRPPALGVSFNAVTDNDGKFTYPTLPPGEYRVSQIVGTAGSGRTEIVSVKSGETTSVKIGGTGRPVIGRIFAIGADQSVVFKIRSMSLALKLSAEAIPRPTDPAAYRDWAEREDVLAQMRAERRYAVQFEDDGSFRAEDIPAGTYTLSVTAGPDAAGASPGSRPAVETFTKEVVISEMTGGRSDTPLDLGVIKFQSTKK
ncbi:MAG: carboxypeptidase-like regulatory domain-containing protein [Acidobacteriia bacterium]|nr:carboxypeptidase-like regulatory domain-containing protein [Terriglobia bacterium]